jgi:cytoskeletal protein RodZ
MKREKVRGIKQKKKRKKKKKKRRRKRRNKLKRIGIILLGLIPMGILWWVKFCNWLAEKIMDSLENIAGSFK